MAVIVGKKYLVLLAQIGCSNIQHTCIYTTTGPGLLVW